MSKRLDVLFVIPGDLKRVYQSLAEEHAIEPPAKARLIAAYLLRRKLSVDLLDANVLSYTPDVMASEVELRNPRLVVVPVYGFNPSSSTQTMPAARVYAQSIKDLCPTIPIVFTGTHPAALPGRTLKEEPVDYVCDGEGPVTVYELLQALGNGDSVKDVRSLWYWEDGVINHNAPAPLLDLNAEPAMDAWFLMDPNKYYAHDWHSFYVDYRNRSPYANPFAREGCPHRCHFCNIQAPYRAGERLEVERGIRKSGTNSFRTLSPENFVSEIQFLAETYGARQFKIPDEMFGSDSYPEKVATLMLERLGSICGELNIWCYFRVDSIRPKDLDLLRKAGFRWLALGIEAADSKVRSGQDKGFRDEHIFKVVRMMEDAGMEGALNYIFGLSNFREDGTIESCDTSETMQATFDLACELNGHFSNFYCDQALPGSPQYDFALRMGYPLPERKGGPGWIGHSQYSYECEPFYPSRALTSAEVLAFRDRAHQTYYSRKEYRAKLLSNPNFGETAIRNIDRMLSRFPLKRKLLENS